MAEQLQIKVGADLQQASQAFVKLQKDIETAMKGGEASMKRFVESYQKLGAASAKTGGAVKKTGRDFTDLGRVIQDLPFGFQGIQNNLTQLVPAAGAAGLAFSALVAGLTFAQVGFRNWIRGSSGVNEATDAIAKKAKETRERIEELTRAFSDIKRDVRAEAFGDTTAEVTKVQALSAVVQDVTKSYKDRNRALDELKNINKSYFGDLTLEGAQISKLTGIVDEYTKALVATAVVKSFSEEIGKVGKELSVQQDNLRDLSGQLQAIAGDYQIIGTKQKGFRLLTPEQNAQAVELRGKIKEQDKFVSDLGNTYKKLQGQINAAILETLKFKTLDEQETKKPKGPTPQFNFFDQFFDVAPDSKRIEQQIIAMVKTARDFAVKHQDLFIGLEDILTATSNQGAIEAGKKFWAAYQQGLVKFKPPRIELKDLNLVPTIKPDTAQKSIDGYLKGLRQVAEDTNAEPMILPIEIKIAEDAAKKFQQEMEAFKAQIDSIAGGYALDMFTSMGEAIAAAAGGANAGQIFAPIFNLIGSFVQEMGKQTIVASKAFLALKKVLASLLANPIGGIAVGVGLVALGAIIKNSVGKVKPFAQGGLVYGPTMGLVGEGRGTNRSNPEVIAPLDKLRDIIGGVAGGGNHLTGEFRIAGKDLVYVLAQNQQSQRRKF